MTGVRLCPHCAAEVPEQAPAAPYCCSGCRAAHRFLRDAHLERYYELRGARGVPVGEAAPPASAWLSPLVERARAQRPTGPLELRLDLEGIHCAGCVWVIEQMFRRQAGGLAVLVNPGRGQLHLRFHEEAFDLEGFLLDLAALGYRAGPARRAGDTETDGLLLRFGIVVALAMNTMILSLSFYFGLEASEGALYDVFLATSWVLSALAVAVGLPVFLRGAWAAWRRGTVHLDLPISLGVILAFLGSTVGLFAGRGDVAYFDTLTVFIALVLFGRWMQRRVVAKNRRLVLETAGADGLWVRRLSPAGTLATVPASAVRAGDELLITPGDHVPVRAVALDDADGLSFAWVSGEPETQARRAGEEIEAGAHHRGEGAFRVKALEAFASSTLTDLLASPVLDEGAGEAGSVHRRVAPAYVGFVLLAALGGGAFWTWTASWQAGLDVAVAVLVVTCPCALALGLPLGRDLTLAVLRRRGVFIRRASLLDRLLTVGRVFFDKTGTLTLRELAVLDDGPLLALHPADRDHLAQMVLRSRHPASRAVARALSARGHLVPLDVACTVRERVGQGMELTAQGHAWALRAGPPAAGGPGEAARSLLFTRDGEVLATLRLEEQIRPDAQAQVRSLRARGLELGVLSGDRDARVKALARRLGIDESEAWGDLRPADKAARVRASKAPVLMIGDGINDVLALEAALCSGSAPGEDGALAARADFFLLGEGLAPLLALFERARRLRQVADRNLYGALLYNALVVTLALLGLMSPLLAALLMPASSISVVLHTALALRADAPGPERSTTRAPARAPELPEVPA